MTFAEYPKMLLRGADELIVEDAEAEQAAVADGYEFKGSDDKPNNEPAKPVEAPKAFVEYPKMLTLGDDYRIVDDEHSEAKARRDGFSVAGEVRKEPDFGADDTTEAPDNAATIKAELDDLGIEYDRRVKDPAKLAKILADAKAATDPES